MKRQIQGTENTQRNLVLGNRIFGQEQVPDYPMEGNTALPCWFAQKHGLDTHSGCAGLTFNSWDRREFMCDCVCHQALR